MRELFSKISSFSDDDETQNEIKNFRQTLHSEVLSKKVGENPPVAELRPEEVPLIASMFADDDVGNKIGQNSANREILNKVKDDADEEMREGIKYINRVVADEESDLNENDEEIQPKNYFFWFFGQVLTMEQFIYIYNIFTPKVEVSRVSNHDIAYFSVPRSTMLK